MPHLIYVVGGSDSSGRLSQVELYDPQNASWTQLSPMTGPRLLHGCVAFDGKLYAVGGLGAAGQNLDTAEVYDPHTDGWQPLAKMTTRRSAFGLAAVGGKSMRSVGMAVDTGLRHWTRSRPTTRSSALGLSWRA